MYMCIHICIGALVGYIRSISVDSRVSGSPGFFLFFLEAFLSTTESFESVSAWGRVACRCLQKIQTVF